MKLMRFHRDGADSVGVMFGQILVDLCGGHGAIIPDIEAVLADPQLVERAQRASRGDIVDLPTMAVSEVRALAPVRRPSKVIGVGLNFVELLRRSGDDPPSHPLLFHKTASAIVGDGAPIRIPPEACEVVPEGELAVSIGATASRVTRSDALRYVAGYTCANDVGARNLESQTTQWTNGKMLDSFCPLGPVLVTPDELGEASGLGIRTRVNDRLVQWGTTSDLLFDVPELISRISHLVTLEPADVILTGAPSDLATEIPPVYLSAGVRVSVEIEGIGTLDNPVEDL